MGRPFIVLGDRTSHGGAVVEASAVTDTHGLRIARVGDRVTCPLQGHGGLTVITGGDPSMVVDGRPAARHGDPCACGATLIAAQRLSAVDAVPADRAGHAAAGAGAPDAPDAPDAHGAARPAARSD